MPLSTTVIDGKRFALINLRTSDKKLHGLSIQTMDFSGESTEESIQRRKSNWIPIVDSLLGRCS